jgi:tRNA(fMet)-specific endonuclease VapC
MAKPVQRRASGWTSGKAGRPVGPVDLLIAATAVEQGAILATHDTREFRRVRGLRVEDWY